MAQNTKIEWAHPPGYRGDTWNCVRGCSRVSRGCEHCYAETVAHRFDGPGLPYEGLTVVGNNGPRWNGEVRFVEERLLDPIRRKVPTCYFVNSMSDLFHEKLSFDIIDKIFAVMALTPRHIYQVLTKRPERMREYFNSDHRFLSIEMAADMICLQNFNHGTFLDTKLYPFPNVWLGVSVEDQKTADERIPILFDTPAAIRWISAEPLLGPIDLTAIKTVRESVEGVYHDPKDLENQLTIDALNGHTIDGNKKGWSWSTGLGWAVVGGESGNGSRPMHPDWARVLRDQCKSAGVPFFFKQWGSWQDGSNANMHESGAILLDGRYFSDDAWEAVKRIPKDEWYANKPTVVSRVGKAVAGHLLDGVEHFAYPNLL